MIPSISSLVSVLLLLLTLCNYSSSNPPRKSHHRHGRNVNLSTNEYIMQIKCEAKCLSSHSNHFCDTDACLREIRLEKKLGSCPRKPLAHNLNATKTNSLVIDSNCIDTCKWDYNCNDADKCCPNSCANSCHRPTDLHRVSALPPVPCQPSVMESRRKIEICWDVYYTEIKVHYTLQREILNITIINPSYSMSSRTKHYSLSSKGDHT